MREMSSLLFMVCTGDTNKEAGQVCGAIALRPVLRLSRQPLDILLVRYLLMLLASLSSTLSKVSEPVHVKARALVVLQRILIRVGGQDKLDKHVS
jgi:hypothetical protein